MADPLSITAGALALLGVVLKVSMTAIGMVDKTTGAHETARDALRNLRRALQKLNKETSNIQTILRILISDPNDKTVKKLLALAEGEDAVKELCESLESTRGLLAERVGQAQLETTRLVPLPQDRRSLEFVRAVFKHNFSRSNIKDAIIALKDFQFEVESCQQTTELAFQQVWRVYDIVKSRTRQSRSSASTISSISTQIPESSTSPQATTSFRREIIDWLEGQDIASKSNLETPYFAAQTGRAGTSAENNTFALESQPTSISRNQDLSRNQVRNFYDLLIAKPDYKETGLAEADQGRWTPQPHVIEQPVYNNHDVVSHQQPRINTTPYGYPFRFTAVELRILSGRNTQRITPITPTDYNRENSYVCGGKDKVSASYFQAPPPRPENQHVDEQPVYRNRDIVSQEQPLTNTTMDYHGLPFTADFLNPTPLTYDQSPGTGIQYGNGLPGVERYSNDGDGLFHIDKRWRILESPMKELYPERKTTEELVRQIVTSGDLQDMYEVCSRASARESAAREAAKALKEELQCADPPRQSAAARLWAIMLFNTDDRFIVETSGKPFMDAVESVILAPNSSPVVKEELLDVLAGAAHTFRGVRREGFQSTWKRVRPRNKPEDGIPFDVHDPMLNGVVWSALMAQR